MWEIEKRKKEQPLQIYSSSRWEQFKKVEPQEQDHSVQGSDKVAQPMEPPREEAHPVVAC